MSYKTREPWLNCVAYHLRPAFHELGVPLPENVRIALGFTSNGARGKRIGECWDSSASVDGHFEIFIRPDLVESPVLMPIKVAAILAHELVHAAVGIRAGHGPAFRRVAKGLGLEGKMTATVAGPMFEALIAPILVEAGPLPHGRLRTEMRNPEPPDEDEGEGGRKPKLFTPKPPHEAGPPGMPGVPGYPDNTPYPIEKDYPLTTGPRKQTMRHIKCKCRVCGYTVRTSRKWLDSSGPPHCPQHGAMAVIAHDTGHEDDD